MIFLIFFFSCSSSELFVCGLVKILAFPVQLPPHDIGWLTALIQLIYFTFRRVRKCKAAFPMETLPFL